MFVSNTAPELFGDDIAKIIETWGAYGPLVLAPAEGVGALQAPCQLDNVTTSGVGAHVELFGDDIAKIIETLGAYGPLVLAPAEGVGALQAPCQLDNVTTSGVGAHVEMFVSNTAPELFGDDIAKIIETWGAYGPLVLAPAEGVGALQAPCQLDNVTTSGVGAHVELFGDDIAKIIETLGAYGPLVIAPAEGVGALQAPCQLDNVTTSGVGAHVEMFVSKTTPELFGDDIAKII